MAFFLFWGGAAAVLPYIAVYFESVHLSGRQIGQLTSIPFFISLISSVAFGFLSDVSMKNRLIMRLCSIGIIVVLFLYPQAQTFASLLPVVLLYSMFHAPTNPILDKMTLDELESPEMYGKVRAGGSIGWGIMVLVTGLLMDKLGFGIHIMFYINIAFMVLFLLITAFMPQTRHHEQATRSDTSLKKLGKFLLHPSFLTISLLIIIWGIGEASIQNFLFLHIKQLGGSSTLMGAALSISLVGEIVTFSLADKIQTKIGEFRMILLAFIVIIIWLVGLSLIKNPAIFPFFQIFGGAGFALIHSGSVAYVNRKAPQELGTTAQALRGGIYAGFGTGVGSLICGALYEFIGSSAMYRTMAFIQMGGLLLGILFYLRERRVRLAGNNQ